MVPVCNTDKIPFYMNTRYDNVTLLLSQTQERDNQLHPAAIWREVCIYYVLLLKFSDSNCVITHMQARFKEAYMDFLKQNHLNGLVDFIKSFVRSRT